MSVGPRLTPASPCDSVAVGLHVRALGCEYVGGSSAGPSSTSMGASHDCRMTPGGPVEREGSRESSGAGSSGEGARKSGAARPSVLGSGGSAAKGPQELAGREGRRQAEEEPEPRPTCMRQPESQEERRKQSVDKSPSHLQRDELQPVQPQQPQQPGTASSQGQDCGGANPNQAPEYPPVEIR